MELALEKQNQINNSLEKQQKKFLETTIGNVINTGVDIGLRAVLPDLIEDEIINVKNVILENGFKARLRYCHYICR